MTNLIKRSKFNNGNDNSFTSLHNDSNVNHKHDFYDYFFVIQGSCTLIVDKNNISLNKNEFILINKNIINKILSSSEDFIYISVGHSNMLFHSLISMSTYKLQLQRMAEIFVLETWNYRVFKNNSDNISRIFQDIYEINTQQMDLKSILIQLKLMEYIVLFLENDSMKINLAKSSSNVISYIGNNLASASLQDFAKLNHVSVSKASNDIQAIYQMNFLEIKHEIQMQETIHLLENPNISIEQILDRIGVVNKTHFYKLFKEAFGTTPKKYRDNYFKKVD